MIWWFLLQMIQVLFKKMTWNANVLSVDLEGYIVIIVGIIITKLNFTVESDLVCINTVDTLSRTRLRVAYHQSVIIDLERIVVLLPAPNTFWGIHFCDKSALIVGVQNWSGCNSKNACDVCKVCVLVHCHVFYHVNRRHFLELVANVYVIEDWLTLHLVKFVVKYGGWNIWGTKTTCTVRTREIVVVDRCLNTRKVGVYWLIK